MAYCASLRADQYNIGKGWVDKPAPPLPRSHSKQSKSKQAMKKMCVASKKEAVTQQQNAIYKMKAEMKLDKDSHSESELQEAMGKLEELREKLHKARRVALGLPQKTREQRAKLREMKAANKLEPDTYPPEMIASETEKLRELMGKWSKRALTQPGGKDGDNEADPLARLRRQVREQERLYHEMTTAIRSSEQGDDGGGIGAQEVLGQEGFGDMGDGEDRARGVQISKDRLDACEGQLKALTDKYQKARRRAFLTKIRAKVKEMKQGLKNEVVLKNAWTVMLQSWNGA